MRDAGCKMIFFGAESSNDEILEQMDKGGTQTVQQIKDFAARMRRFDIIPEYSFVLGIPLETEEEVRNQIEKDIAFIKEIKTINPDTEIIIYLYSPVPTEGSELYETVKKAGFSLGAVFSMVLLFLWKGAGCVFPISGTPFTWAVLPILLYAFPSTGLTFP